MSRLFIRTEASAQIGMGHFMRCFAVAECAQHRDIDVTFLLSTIDDTVIARCQPLDIATESVVDFGLDIDGIRARVTSDDWLLIDSYNATADYISTVHHACRVAIIDDLNALDWFDCDVLINPAMAASRKSYAKKSNAQLLLGPAFALIRNEFRIPCQPLVAGPSVAVMFGGSDPTGLTATVAKLVHAALPDVTVKVIAGPANIRIAELEALAEDLPRMRLFLSPPDMGRVLAGSDLVITAAGGSVGEVAAMGLPAMVLVVYDNQKTALEACPFPATDIRSGLPSNLADRIAALIRLPDLRRSMGEMAHNIVDGMGAQRVVEAMFLDD